MWQLEWTAVEHWNGELGLRYVDLADITHIEPHTIGKLMTNKLGYVAIADLAAICEAMQCDVGDILRVKKGTDILKGDERRDYIAQNVHAVREKRKAKNQRRRDTEAMKIQALIDEAVRQALSEHGIPLDDMSTD